jgi:N-acetylmuramoyl-L-alanine amidase
VFKSAGILFFAALALVLAGCTTTPAPPDEIISPAPVSGGTAALNWSAPGFAKTPVVPASKTNAPPVVRSNLPPATTPKPAPAPVVTWTSLNRWAAEHKLVAPRVLSRTPVTTYAVGSSNGVMLLAIGSLEAGWNGTQINLGFEPQLIDGEVFLHGLDLQKNLEPLLCRPPLAFGTNRVIVIDPGHGGVNTGTHSVLDGRFEKEFTLDWAERLKPLLETNGWTVFLTRTNDSEITLANRVAFAGVHHADVFMSLHFNSAAPETNQAGIEIYCLTPTGMPSTLTRGFADLWSDNFPNNRFDADNLQLAVRLQGELLQTTDEEDRGVRRARFMGVLQGQNRPAVLVEAGYLSNPAEAEKIESAAYRQKLSEAVAAALK